MTLLVLTLFACGEKVSDINRVQPYYIQKSNLAGDWYYRQTIVEVPPEGAIGFEGIEGALEKVRFEVRERQLIAYRIHPSVEGLEDDRTEDGAVYQGEPVAIFAISSHFDILRDFNSTTGTQSNVLGENTSLNPWYERQYIRVDWSSNIIEGGVDFGGFFKAIATSSYYDRDHDPYDPDRLRIEDDFIFFTNNYVVYDGGYACLSGFGAPSGAGGYGNCGSVEIKVRNAFARIDLKEARQFEPVSYNDRERLYDEQGEPLRVVTATVGESADTIDFECTDEVLERLGAQYDQQSCQFLTWNQMGRFGFFRSARYAYDRRVGSGHDVARQVYANHHQMWKETRREDGSKIPLVDREVRPIVYYLNTDFPEDLKDVAVKIGANWDDVFMEAAMAATGKREVVIRDQLRRDADPDAVYLDTDIRRAGALFQVRENQCSVAGVNAYTRVHGGFEQVISSATRFEGMKPGNMERVCAAVEFYAKERGLPPFYWQQMGDLRLNFLWWINEDQPGGPLGYGPSSADIETGQIISGNAHIYGTAIDQYARSAADTVRALNGDLPFNDIVDGQHLRDWLNRGSDAAQMSDAATDDMRAILSERIGTPFMEGERDFHRDDGHADMGKIINHMHGRMAHPAPNDPIVRAMQRPQDRKAVMMEAIKQDPAMRARFTDPEMVTLVGALYGWKPGMERPEGMDALALEMSLDPGAIGRKMQARSEFFADKNVYLAEFLDDSVIGQASQLKGLPADEVYKILRQEIFEAVALHEIGHTVGMTHNFEASFDALNYQKEFWEIRRDLPESAWNEARLPEYRYASIMDYGSRFNSDTKGLGRYDFATIKFLYGHSLEEFEDDVPVPGQLGKLIKLNDYTKIPALLGGDVENLWKRKNVSIEQSIASKKERLRINTEAFLSNVTEGFLTDKTVPYGYCFDGFNGDLRCKTWDEGSNHTESVKGAIQRYWSYYIFNNFRRGRDEGSFINGFFGRMSRMMDYLTYPWQFYYFYDAYPVDVRDDLLNAAVMGLNFVNEVVGTPEPGEYCEYVSEDGVNLSGEEGGPCTSNSECAEGSVCRQDQCVLKPTVFLPASFFSAGYQNVCRKVDVQLGEGRNQFFEFSDDHLYKIDYIGSYFEKSNLLSTLFFDSTRFFRVADQSDVRRFTVGYYRAFREEIVKMVRDMVLGTLINGSVRDGTLDFLTDSIHARYVDEDGILRAQPLVDPERFGTTERASAKTEAQLYTPVPYNLAMRAATLATIYNTTSYDQEVDLVEYLTISELGSGDDRVTDGREQEVFVNPITGQSYVATQTWDKRSIAFEFLQRINVFVETDWRPAKAEYEEDPSDERNREYFERLDRQLNEFIEMADYLREMRSMMDFGQAGGWR